VDHDQAALKETMCCCVSLLKVEEEEDWDSVEYGKGHRQVAMMMRRVIKGS
jgi:hypothetical protein